MNKPLYKLVVFVPQTHLEQVRIAISNAGGGKIGNYDNCMFISSGIGTYMPLMGSKPSRGEVGKLERVGEARIEVTVSSNDIKGLISAVKKIHPYEEPVIDVYRLESV